MTQTSTQLHLTACLPLQLTTPAPARPQQHKQLPAQTPQGTLPGHLPGFSLSLAAWPRERLKGEAWESFPESCLEPFSPSLSLSLLPAPPSELVPAGSVCVCVCLFMSARARAHVLSHVQLLAKPRNVARQALLSMGFPKEEYWSGLPFPSPGYLPNPGIQLKSLASPALAGGSFTTSATREAPAGSSCCIYSEAATHSLCGQF